MDGGLLHVYAWPEWTDGCADGVLCPLRDGRVYRCRVAGTDPPTLRLADAADACAPPHAVPLPFPARTRVAVHALPPHRVLLLVVGGTALHTLAAPLAAPRPVAHGTLGPGARCVGVAWARPLRTPLAVVHRARAQHHVLVPLRALRRDPDGDGAEYDSARLQLGAGRLAPAAVAAAIAAEPDVALGDGDDGTAGTAMVVEAPDTPAEEPGTGVVAAGGVAAGTAVVGVHTRGLGQLALARVTEPGTAQPLATVLCTLPPVVFEQALGTGSCADPDDPGGDGTNDDSTGGSTRTDMVDRKSVV